MQIMLRVRVPIANPRSQIDCCSLFKEGVVNKCYFELLIPRSSVQVRLSVYSEIAQLVRAGHRKVGTLIASYPSF